MSISIDLYRVLTDDLSDKIGYSVEEYKFSYSKEGIDIPLNADANDAYGMTQSTMLLSDKNCEWRPDTHDLKYSRRCQFRTPFFLFGQGGIAHEDSVIGVALIWLSKTSSQRGAISIGEITKSSRNVDFILSSRIPPDHIKGRLTMQTILYLKACPHAIQGFASSTGTILGTLDSSEIIFDGTGSEFPIVEVNEPSQPLWYVKCNWVDPLSDAFDEDNVCLCINSAHPHYPMLKLDDRVGSSPNFTEVIASAMQTIVQKAVNSKSFEKILSGEDVEAGSIAQAINYFITTFGWDCSSPERLALTIRRDIDSRF